jgi:hypothetical protein
MLKLFPLLLLLVTQSTYSKTKVIYKYKQYEKFDLGDMEVKGSIVAPGDLSVKERRRKIFKREFYKRENLKDIITNEIKVLR